MFWHIHSILNVLKYVLTTIEVVLEKSETFHKQPNRKYFVGAIYYAFLYKGEYFKMNGILKYVSFK